MIRTQNSGLRPQALTPTVTPRQPRSFPMLFCFIFALFFTFFLGVRGGSTNYTIDDTKGDSRTGAIPTYTSDPDDAPYGDAWTENCEGCWVVPNPNDVFDGTWHHATDLHSGYTGLTASFAFTGNEIHW
jgi:hypothetical protein